MKLANPGSPGEMDVKNGEYEIDLKSCFWKFGRNLSRTFQDMNNVVEVN